MKKHRNSSSKPRRPPERREHDRFHIKDAVVEHMKVDFVSFTDKNLRRRDPMVNVSVGGMLFTCDDSFPLGQPLSLIMHLPDCEAQPKMRAEVVRCVRLPGDVRYHVGVRFTMCCVDAANLLQSLVQESQRRPDRVQLYVSTRAEGAA